jgi:GNAT superfamily N-acetyltransferase
MQPEIVEFHRDGYTVSTDPARLDLALIHDYLTNRSYWVPGISFSDVEEAARHSLNFGLYLAGKQIGYARLLTDCVRFAYLMDVFVLEEQRGRGLGKWLMACVMQHPALQRVQRWMLATWDAHGFYAQFGFQPLALPDRWMEFVNRQKRSGL